MIPSDHESKFAMRDNTTGVIEWAMDAKEERNDRGKRSVGDVLPHVNTSYNDSNSLNSKNFSCEPHPEKQEELGVLRPGRSIPHLNPQV